MQLCIRMFRFFSDRSSHHVGNRGECSCCIAGLCTELVASVGKEEMGARCPVAVECGFESSCVLDAVRVGLTKKKDAFFQLWADSDKVVVCTSNVLRQTLANEKNNIVQRFIDTLDRRDLDRGEQIVLLHLGGDKGFLVQTVVLPIAIDEQQNEEKKE